MPDIYLGLAKSSASFDLIFALNVIIISCKLLADNKTVATCQMLNRRTTFNLNGEGNLPYFVITTTRLKVDCITKDYMSKSINFTPQALVRV